MRYPERYQGEQILVHAAAYQIVSSDRNAYQIAAYMWENALYSGSGQILIIHALDRGPRVLEGDRVQFVGRMTGLHQAKTTMGEPLTLPMIDVIRLHVGFQRVGAS